MPALVRTGVVGRVVWLGRQRVPVKDLVITAEPVAEMRLRYDEILRRMADEIVTSQVT